MPGPARFSGLCANQTAGNLSEQKRRSSRCHKQLGVHSRHARGLQLALPLVDLLRGVHDQRRYRARDRQVEARRAQADLQPHAIRQKKLYTPQAAAELLVEKLYKEQAAELLCGLELTPRKASRATR